MEAAANADEGAAQPRFICKNPFYLCKKEASTLVFSFLSTFWSWS